MSHTRGLTLADRSAKVTATDRKGPCMTENLTPEQFVEDFIRINNLEEVPSDLDDYRRRLLAAIAHEERTASEPDWHFAACEVYYDADDGPAPDLDVGLPDLRIVH